MALIINQYFKEIWLICSIAFHVMRICSFHSFLTRTVNGEVYTSEVTDPQDTAGLGLGNLEIGRSGGILSPL